ncbi:MAG TPA: ATP-binding protein [Acidimicrobiales bacterium]|nr:ATP-binding protein [Acidimicrobiales bacterium]
MAEPTRLDVLKVTLEPEPAAERTARALVRQALSERVAPEVLDDAELVTAELVANAIKHAGTAIDLRVEGPDDDILIRVTDTALGTMPRYMPVSVTAESGRGLHLVDALCSRWGFDLDLEHDCKTVWCRVSREPRPMAAPGRPGDGGA